MYTYIYCSSPYYWPAQRHIWLNFVEWTRISSTFFQPLPIYWYNPIDLDVYHHFWPLFFLPILFNMWQIFLYERMMLCSEGIYVPCSADSLNKSLWLPYFQAKLVVETMLKKASCTQSNGRGMRYEAEFLFQCLMIRIQDVPTYKQLRDSGMLPLPSLSTIRRYLSCMPCQMGFSDFSLKCIQRQMKNLSCKNGSMVWDEMSSAEDCTWNEHNLLWEGFVEFGDGVKIEDHQRQPADHLLLFVYRPYKARWIQPIGVFASKGAASAAILHQLIVQVFLFKILCTRYLFFIIYLFLKMRRASPFSIIMAQTWSLLFVMAHSPIRARWSCSELMDRFQRGQDPLITFRTQWMTTRRFTSTSTSHTYSSVFEITGLKSAMPRKF